MTKGYQFPEVIDPGEAICIPVYVPKDRAYIAAFFGSLDYLATWLAWERDDAGTGATVAAVWKPWVEFTKLMFDTAGCEGGQPVDLRQNPESPCELQRDDGEGWETWANVSSCLTILQNPLPPYPDEEPEDAKRLAAQNIVGWLLERIYIRTADDIEASVPQQDIANNVAQDFSQVAPGKNVQQAAEYFVQKVFEQTPAERLLKKDPSEWEELYWGFFCKTRGDGAFLDQAANSIFGVLNRSTNWAFEALNQAAELFNGGDWGRALEQGVALGVATAEMNGWLPPEDTFCANYGIWYADLDFITSMHGFQIVPLPAEQGEWVSGSGWTSTLGRVCNYADNLRCIMGFKNFNSHLLNIVQHGTMATDIFRDGWDCDSLGYHPVEIEFPGDGVPPEQAVFVTDLVLYFYIPPAGTFLTRVEIFGTGAMPDFG